MHFKKRRDKFLLLPLNSLLKLIDPHFQLEVLKHYLDGGGNVLVMLGEGGELKYDTNINFLLEEYGIMVNSGVCCHLSNTLKVWCISIAVTLNLLRPPPSHPRFSSTPCCCLSPQTPSWGTCTTNISIPKRRWCLTEYSTGRCGCHWCKVSQWSPLHLCMLQVLFRCYHCALQTISCAKISILKLSCHFEVLFCHMYLTLFFKRVRVIL